MIRWSVVGLMAAMAMMGCGNAVQESTARVGTSGGALTAGKTTLLIPAGALQTETEVRLREVETPLGRHLEMEPRVGLTTPAHVEVEVEHGVDLARVQTRRSEDRGTSSLRRRDDAQRGVIELELERLGEVEIENPADDHGAAQPGDDKGATRPGDDKRGG